MPVGVDPYAEQRSIWQAAQTGQAPAAASGGDWFEQNTPTEQELAAPAALGGGGDANEIKADPMGWLSRQTANMPPTEENLIKLFDQMKAAGVNVSRPTRATGALSSDKLSIDGQMYDLIRDVGGSNAGWQLGSPIGSGGGGGGDFGSFAQGFGKDFQAPSIEQIRNMPGYQFMIEQGLKAMDTGAAAKGTLLAGGRQKDRAAYAMGIGDQTAQQAYQNALGEYKTQYDIFRNDRNDIFDRYNTMAQRGTNAANAATS